MQSLASQENLTIKPCLHLQLLQPFTLHPSVSTAEIHVQISVAVGDLDMPGSIALASLSPIEVGRLEDPSLRTIPSQNLSNPYSPNELPYHKLLHLDESSNLNHTISKFNDRYVCRL